MEEKQAKTPRTRSRRTVHDSAVLSVPTSPETKKRRVAKKVESSKKTLTTTTPKPESSATKKRAPRPFVKKNVEQIAHVSVAHEAEEEHRVPIIRNQLQLALLSPFRFPIDHASLAAQVARIGGVALVVVGALFTLINMQFLGGAIMAEHRTEELQQIATLTAYNCVDTLSPNYSESFCAMQVSSGVAGLTTDTTPDVELRMDSSMPYANTVPIQITVPYATQVVVSAYAKDEGRNILLGNAFRLDDLHWVYHWDTKKYADGVYRLKVVVTNTFGSYSHSDSTDRLLQNFLTATTIHSTESVGTSATGTTGTAANATTTTTSETVRTATTTDTTNVSTTAVETTAPSILLAIDKEAPITGDAAISIIVANASSVKLYARNAETGTSVALGNAIYKGNNEWRYVWNTKQVPNEPYRVRAVVSVGGAFYESDFTQTSVHNEQAATVASTTVATNPATITSSTMLPQASQIAFQVAGSDPRKDNVDVFVAYPNAQFVELYVQPHNALVPRFLGLAAKKSTADWQYRWDTRQTPNGTYALYARVGTEFGAIESLRSTVRVENIVDTLYSPAEETYLEDIEDVTALLEKPITQTAITSSTSEPELRPQNAIFIKSIDAVVDGVEVDDALRTDIERYLEEFKKELDAAMIDYARAVREADATAIETTMQHIEELRSRVISSLSISPERREILDAIDADLREIIRSLTEMTKRNETIIKERIGDRVFADADRDGISDYDEVNIYSTNPFAADTDADGYNDDAEIRGGFDPRDARGETLIVHESPKEAGVVRDDILTVQSITTLPQYADEEDGDGVPVTAVISGTALPNSFVTLYIFSTPIVVTVKTDSEGAWSYIFDKELENGEHEIYVGLTDNAGRVIAKSSPLPFVKTAEAFTPIDVHAGSPITVADEAPSLMTDRLMLVIASIAVVALGLVLILLGLHVARRQEQQIALQ